MDSIRGKNISISIAVVEFSKFEHTSSLLTQNLTCVQKQFFCTSLNKKVDLIC